jgi:hypothetical protein
LITDRRNAGIVPVTSLFGISPLPAHIGYLVESIMLTEIT